MKLGALFPNLKAWSNFRLMVVVGSVVTILSLALGAVVVQAALSNDAEPARSDPGSEAAREPDSRSAAAEQEAAQSEASARTGTVAAENPVPQLDSGATFRISCLAGNATDTQNTCQVESFGGFAGRVDLSCAGLPPSLSCSFTPASLVPRANGSTTFRLELSAGDVPPGSYVFDVVGRSGNELKTYRYPWRVAAPPVAVDRPALSATPDPGADPADPASESAAARGEPTFSFTCGSLTEGNRLAWSLARDGDRVRIHCFLTPLNGFNEPVAFTFAQEGDLAKPDTVRFSTEQLQAKKQFDLTFDLSDAVRRSRPEQLRTGRDYAFEVTGTSASGKSLTRRIPLTVTE